MTGMDIQWRADETIRFPQSTEDFMYQSLGLLSIGAGLAWGANIVPLGLAALAAPGAYAAYSVSRVMKSSKGKEDGLKAAEGCGALIGASMTGALALGAGYAIGAALNSMMYKNRILLHLIAHLLELCFPHQSDLHQIIRKFSRNAIRLLV